jgi:hypothetical protein
MSHDVVCMAVVFIGARLVEGGGNAMWATIFFIKQYNRAGTLQWGFDRTSPMLSNGAHDVHVQACKHGGNTPHDL